MNVQPSDSVPKVTADSELTIQVRGESFCASGRLRAGLTSALLGCIWFYKHLLSPPLHLLSGPRSGCRFYPSCSDYAAEAVRVHGPLGGAWLALRRLLRCTPLHPGGVDFVPPRAALRPRCARTT